jgi:hypothetical protein
MTFSMLQFEKILSETYAQERPILLTHDLFFNDDRSTLNVTFFEVDTLDKESVVPIVVLQFKLPKDGDVEEYKTLEHWEFSWICVESDTMDFPVKFFARRGDLKLELDERSCISACATVSSGRLKREWKQLLRCPIYSMIHFNAEHGIDLFDLSQNLPWSIRIAGCMNLKSRYSEILRELSDLPLEALMSNISLKVPSGIVSVACQ